MEQIHGLIPQNMGSYFVSSSNGLNGSQQTLPMQTQFQHGHSPVTLSTQNNNGHIESPQTNSSISGSSGDDCDSKDKKNDNKITEKVNGMTQEELAYRGLPDHLREGLDIVVIGINPSITSAQVGHHYAGPGNHFWACVTQAGLVPKDVTCYDDSRMLEYGIGFTNVCTRPTKGAAELTRKEMKQGAEILLEKIKRTKPKIVVFNGKGIYEAFVGHKNFYMGRQPQPLKGTDTVVFVMPSSSARCAQLPRADDKLPFFISLKKLLEFVRGDRAELDDAEVVFPDYAGLRVSRPDPKSLAKAERRRKRKAEQQKLEEAAAGANGVVVTPAPTGPAKKRSSVSTSTPSPSSTGTHNSGQTQDSISAAPATPTGPTVRPPLPIAPGQTVQPATPANMFSPGTTVPLPSYQTAPAPGYTWERPPNFTTTCPPQQQTQLPQLFTPQPTQQTQVFYQTEEVQSAYAPRYIQQPLLVSGHTYLCTPRAYAPLCPVSNAPVAPSSAYVPTTTSGEAAANFTSLLLSDGPGESNDVSPAPFPALVHAGEDVVRRSEPIRFTDSLQLNGYISASNGVYDGSAGNTMNINGEETLTYTAL